MARESAGALTVGDVLDALRHVRWPTARRVRGGPTGAHRARTRGTTAEFTEYRAYRQGDEVRRVDWKLLARTDRAYVRLTEDHTVLPTTIVVDGSASMAYPEETRAKWVHAARVAVGLAAAAHTTGDPVGLRVAGGSWLPPRMRRSVVAELASVLRNATPLGAAPIAPLLRELEGRIAIVSDFLGDAEAILAAARAARARGCEVYAVHVVDTWELEPPAAAALVADPEEPGLRRPLVRASRAAYQENFAAWRSGLARDWRTAGLEYVLTVSGTRGEEAAHAVRRIVRRRGGTGSPAASDAPR